MKGSFILLLLMCTSVLFAVSTSQLTGTVIDAETGQPLPGANVFIVGTFLGSGSDQNGAYSINRLDAGSYVLKAAYMGYSSSSVQINLAVGESATVNFNLKSTSLPGEQIVVTGSRQPENLASAAGSINVLGKEEMARRANFRIDEALSSLPGVALVGENINIRGGSGYNRLGGSRALVLLDDVPMLTSDLGEANWSLVPITEVEHIEVSKGAASSLYGSGALSGVVNIKTKQASFSPSLSFRQTSGFYDKPSVPGWQWTDSLRHFDKTDLSYSQSFGTMGLRLAVTRHVSTGDRQNGQFQRWYVTAKVNTQLPGNSTLTLFSTYSRENRGLFLQWLEQDHALQPPGYDAGKRVSLSGYVGYAVWNKLFSPRSSFKMRLSYNQQLVGIPFDLSGLFTPAVGLGGEMQWNWKPHPAHSVAAGLDYKLDKVESTYYGVRTANGLSPYIQEIWKFSDILQLNAGLRWDNYILVGDSVETQISPKIGFSYQPFQGTIMHCSIGRAFRAATVVERFLEVGSKDFRWKPNPDLAPERSSLLDIGLRQNLHENLYLEAAWFLNRYAHLIEPTLFNDLTAQFVNYPLARISGLETEMRWRLFREHLHLNVTATWMDHQEIATGEPLSYRPHFIAFAAPAFWWGAWGFEVDFRYMSRLRKVSVYPLDERVPVKLVDLRLHYTFKPISLQLVVRNALNYNYTVSERVLGEIRSFSAVLSGNL